MLKRSGAGLLTLLYIVTVIGFAVNLRYCGKLVAGVKFDAPAKVCNNVMAGKMKCCHDKQINIRIKDAHQGETPSFSGKIFSFQLAGLPVNNGSFSAQATVSQTFFDKGPPGTFFDNIPAFIRNCTFRI